MNYAASLTLLLLLVSCSTVTTEVTDTLPIEEHVEMHAEVAELADPDDVILTALLSRAAQPEIERFIAGRCLCRQNVDGTTEFPCENVKIVLRDERGRVIRRVESVDGEFVFAVDKSKRYHLEVESKRHYPFPGAGPGELGDNVVLHLVEK